MHSHYPLLAASTLLILPLATTMSSVPSLVLYAYVLLGRVGIETRYLTDNGDLTILTDSVDSSWTAVKSLWISTLTK